MYHMEWSCGVAVEQKNIIVQSIQELHQSTSIVPIYGGLFVVGK